jgi:hypothetical protein
MIWISYREFKWVCEDSCRFLEGNTMIALIQKILALIPFYVAFVCLTFHLSVSHSFV